MKYYKTPNNEIMGIEEGQEFIVQHDWIVMSDAEVSAFLNPPKTIDQLKIEIMAAIQNFLDLKAAQKGYDNIVSACSYAGYPNPFQAEAIAFGTWRANIWAYAYQELAKVEAGTRTIPTKDEFIAELPTLTLP